MTNKYNAIKIKKEIKKMFLKGDGFVFGENKLNIGDKKIETIILFIMLTIIISTAAFVYLSKAEESKSHDLNVVLEFLEKGEKAPEHEKEELRESFNNITDGAMKVQIENVISGDKEDNKEDRLDITFFLLLKTLSLTVCLAFLFSAQVIASCFSAALVLNATIKSWEEIH